MNITNFREFSWENVTSNTWLTAAVALGVAAVGGVWQIYKDACKYRNVKVNKIALKNEY